MALFNFLKKNSKEKERFSKKQKNKKALKKAASFEYADNKNSAPVFPQKLIDQTDSVLVLKSPHITEKSVLMNEKGAYVFKVEERSNKIIIKKAIEKLYSVHVEKVNITKSPAKKIFVKGKWGMRSGFKKAAVYLKKGEKIEI